MRGVERGGGYQAQDEGEKSGKSPKLEARDWMAFTCPPSRAGNF